MIPLYEIYKKRQNYRDRKQINGGLGVEVEIDCKWA